MVITRPGPPEVLELRDLPVPLCGPGQVRVRVRAAGLNRADLLQRRGLYPAPPGYPEEIPGLEFAGEVEASGDQVEGLDPGDRVMGILGGGGYAERVCVDAGLCLPVPGRLSWSEAAAIPEAFLTAFDALDRQGELRSGQALLVHAAASGVGVAAVQLGLAAGATVIGLSRTPHKRQRLVELGLRHVLDPARADLAPAIREIVGREGVDLALNLLGAAALPLELELLRVGGRVVVIGLLGGARVEIDLGLLMRKRLRISGSVLRGRPLAEKVELTGEWRRRAQPMLERGRIAPVLDRCFPLEAAAEAHRYMEQNRNFGKVVLKLEHEG
jgi:putative PIG3 family NAD(P)H quinone oxidoreductase